jgi:hypothetical protein
MNDNAHAEGFKKNRGPYRLLTENGMRRGAAQMDA